MIRMIMNYFQQMNMISTVDLGWTPDIRSYFNFQNYMSFLTDDLFSNECLFEKFGYNMLFLKALYSNILPLLLLFLLLLIFYGVKIYKKRANAEKTTELIDEMKVTVIVVVYILYPEIIKKCLSLTSCMTINEVSQRRVLVSSPDIVCGSSHHTLWILAITIPGL